MAELTNHARPDDKRNQQSSKDTENGAQGQVVEDIESTVKLLQVLSEMKQH